MGKLALAALIGALFELDNFSIGMFLIAQPIITGAVSGYLLGDMQMGIMIGCLIQLIWANTPPFGAYVPPSSSAIAFITTALIIIIRSTAPNLIVPSSLMMFCLIGGVAIGFFVGQMDIWNRKLNISILHRFESKIREGNGIYILVVNFFAVTAKLARDFLLYFFILTSAVPLILRVYKTLPGEITEALKISWWIMPVLGFAVIFDMFRTKQGAVIHGITLFVSYIVFSFYKVNIVFFLLALFAAGVFMVYNSVWEKNEASL